MGQKNDFHAFSYNSAESEPISMKVGPHVGQSQVSRVYIFSLFLLIFV